MNYYIFKLFLLSTDQIYICQCITHNECVFPLAVFEDVPLFPAVYVRLTMTLRVTAHDTVHYFYYWHNADVDSV